MKNITRYNIIEYLYKILYQEKIEYSHEITTKILVLKN